jgi:hypothetical protein
MERYLDDANATAPQLLEAIQLTRSAHLSTHSASLNDAIFEWTRNDEQFEYLVSTDRSKLDGDMTFELLVNTYWADLRPRRVVDISLLNSVCFGLYIRRLDGTSDTNGHARACIEQAGKPHASSGWQQIGFARTITDHATYAYLCDVVLANAFQRKGLGAWLSQCSVLKHPYLPLLRRYMLVTRDMQAFYTAVAGFTPLLYPERYVVVVRVVSSCH